MEKISNQKIHFLIKFLVVLLPFLAGYEISEDYFWLVLDPVILKTNVGIIVSALIFVFFTIFHIRKKREIIFSKELIPVLLFLFLSFASILWSINTFTAINVFLAYVSFFIIYLVSLNIYKGYSDFYQLIQLLTRTQLLIVLVGMLQIYYPGSVSFINQFAPPSGTFGNANFFGQYLVFLLPINIYFLLRGNRINQTISLLNILPTFIIIEKVAAAQVYLALFILVISLFVHQLIYFFINKKFQFSNKFDLLKLLTVFLDHFENLAI